MNTTNIPNRAQNRHRLRIVLIFLGAYILHVALQRSIVDPGILPGEGSERIAFALLPALPLLALAFLYVFTFRQLDEVLQRMTLLACGIALMAVALSAIAYRQMEMIGYPRLSAAIFWHVSAAAWLVSFVATWWRYR